MTAKASLRQIESAEKAFYLRQMRYGTLAELGSEGLIRKDLAQGLGDGYKFNVRVGDKSFAALAIPERSVDETLPAYYLDQTGNLHQNKRGNEANANDELAPET